MESKFQMGDLVQSNGLGHEFCSHESPSAKTYLPLLKSKVISKIVSEHYSQYHDSFFYKVHSDGNYYSEEGLDIVEKEKSKFQIGDKVATNEMSLSFLTAESYEYKNSDSINFTIEKIDYSARHQTYVYSGGKYKPHYYNEKGLELANFKNEIIEGFSNCSITGGEYFNLYANALPGQLPGELKELDIAEVSIKSRKKRVKFKY